MKADHRCRLVLALIAATLFALAAPAAAEPAHNLKIVVPYPPASGPDILSRLMGDQIGRAQNVTVVVENRPGGGTTIGTEAVARMAPDGNTVLLVANSFVVNPALKKGNYTVTGSFEPVCQLAATPMVLMVKGDSPYKTVADLLAAARAKPGELSVAGAPNSSLQMLYEVFKHDAKLNMTFVPYPGTAPAINTLLGGHVTAVAADYPTVVPHLKSGVLRALFTGSTKRIEPLPDVPTYAEAGLGKYQDEIFYGLMAPAKTPADAIKRLSGWFTEAMNASEVKPKLTQQGLFTSIHCGAEFGAYLHDRIESYGRIIHDAGIVAQ